MEREPGQPEARTLGLTSATGLVIGTIILYAFIRAHRENSEEQS